MMIYIIGKSQGIVDTTINLLWNPSDFPVVRTTLENAIEVLDNVLAVGSDTYMYSDHGFVIEFFHDGEVTIGRSE
ncbi:CDI toxin immunity protein [Bacillus mojavensis]